MRFCFLWNRLGPFNFFKTEGVGRAAMLGWYCLSVHCHILAEAVHDRKQWLQARQETLRGGYERRFLLVNAGSPTGCRPPSPLPVCVVKACIEII